MSLYFFDYFESCAAGSGDFGLAHPVVGEIYRRLGAPQGHDQGGAPALIKIGQGPLMLAQGLAQLGRRFGIHQIRHGLGPGQIQLAVFHRPAAELARLGGAQAQVRKGAKQCLAHRPSAMNVEFGDILAGKTVRRSKPQHQGLVDFAPAMGQAPQHGPARRGQGPRQGPDAGARQRPRDPHHRHPGPAWRTGQRENAGIHEKPGGKAICRLF